MVNAARTTVIAVLALVGVVLSALSVTISTTVQLLATYAIKGTQVPVFDITSDQAISQEAIQYIGSTPYGQTEGTPPPSQVVVVNYPATMRPFSVGGFSGQTWDQSVAIGVTQLQQDTAGDPSPVIFGYSQGAIVASQYKKAFNQEYAGATAGVPQPTFVFIGNGDRPNGGVLARFSGLYVPLLDLTATSATPTQTAGAAPGQITTYDIAGEYDPIADFPTNPLDPFSDVNALFGLPYVHLNYANLNPSDAVLQGTYGDTAYYLIPATTLPMLMPLEQLPVVGPALADTLDPTLRVLVEAGYNRTTNPGVPTTADLFYFPNPGTFASSLLLSIPTGLDNGVSDLTGGIRPFGTTPVDTSGEGAYGIGGPPVTLPGQTDAPLAPTSDVQSASTASEQSTLLTKLFTTFDTSAGLPALIDPTTLLSDIAQFSQLTSILNGGLPASIPSLFGLSTGMPSLLDSLTGLGSAGQSFAGLTNDNRSASVSAPSATSSPSSTPDLHWAPNISVHNDVAHQNTAPRHVASPDTGSSDTKPAPGLRLPLSMSPFSGTVATTPSPFSGTVAGIPSPPHVANPVGSAVSRVTNSIKAELGDPPTKGGTHGDISASTDKGAR